MNNQKLSIVMVSSLGLVVAALITAIFSMGGPRDAWLKTESAFGRFPPPLLIAIGADKRRVLASARNPSLDVVVVTAIEIMPLPSEGQIMSAATENVSGPLGSAGAPSIETLEQVDTKSTPRQFCRGQWTLDLNHPVTLQPQQVGQISVPAAVDPTCGFLLRLHSDHGLSNWMEYHAPFKYR